MKKKDILILLKKHPGRASVSQAVQWITSQRASTDNFSSVLELLVAIPEFDSYLLWFAQWMVSVHWNVLQSSVSTELFNATLRLLEKSLHLPDRGQVLVLYLDMFYDDNLTRVAKKWLIEYGGTGGIASQVAVPLLLIDHRPEFVDFVRDLAHKNADSKLISALLEYSPDSNIEKLGLDCLTNLNRVDASEIASALLRRDAKFTDAVRAYLSRISEAEISLAILGTIASTCSDGSDLVLEWIRAHEQSKSVPEWLSSLLFSNATPKSYEFAWDWFKTNEGKAESLDVLLSIVNARGTKPPETMVEYAMRWARVNEEHELAAHFFYAIVAGGNPQQKVTFGHYCLRDFTVEDQGPALRAMVKHSGDSESIRLAKSWIDTHEKNQTDDFVASMILLLLRKGPDNNLLELAKRRLAKSKPGDEAAYIQVLLESAVPEGIVEAKKYLMPHRLESRSRDKHMQNGLLLKSLLAQCPGDPVVVERTGVWLSRAVERHEQAQKTAVQAAYEKSEAVSAK